MVTKIQTPQKITKLVLGNYTFLKIPETTDLSMGINKKQYLKLEKVMIYTQSYTSIIVKKYLNNVFY